MAKVKVNVKGLKNFQKALKVFNHQKVSEEAVKELAQRLLTKVVKRTPVGKKPSFKGISRTVKVKGVSGKSKAMLSKEGAILQQYWSGYVGGTLRRGWQIGDVEHTGNVFRVQVFNNVYYARYVEYGHRQATGRYVPQIGKTLKQGWVPGQFMLTISEQEVQQQALGIIEKRMRAMLKEAIDVK